MINLILMADTWFENFMLSVRTPFLVQVFSEVTFFGNTITIIGIAGIIGTFLLFSKTRRVYIAGFITTLLGSAASVYALKVLVARARPSGLIPAITEISFSFPSGHATASIALYGFLAFLLCRLYPERKRVVLMVAIAIILAIGFSRLYLGAHFPSDVIAGYALGGLWLLLGIWITNRIQSSHPSA